MEVDKSLSDLSYMYGLKEFELSKKWVQLGKTATSLSVLRWLISNSLYQHEYRHMWE